MVCEIYFQNKFMQISCNLLIGVYFYSKAELAVLRCFWPEGVTEERHMDSLLSLSDSFVFVLKCPLN